MTNRTTSFYLFLFLFALYLVTYSPTLHSSDGLAMFATAESLVRRGAWDIEQIRWMDLQQGTYGLDGLLYSRKGIGQPLLALPLTWLGLLLPGFGPVTTTLLFGSLVTALTAVLLFALLRRLAYSERTALLTTLLFGTATLAWPYAKTFFSDPLAGLLLLGATLALLTFKQSGRSRYAFLTGLALAWAVATRYAEGIFLPVFGVLLLAGLSARHPIPHNKKQAWRVIVTHWWPPILAFAIPIAAVGLGLIAFNIGRYGDPLNTGYLPEETFSAIWWQGIGGQLFSPGRGLFLYSPILLLSLPGAVLFWQRHRLEALACLAVILIHLLLYGKWFMWHGGFAWGPRFMIPTLPFWAALLAPIVEKFPFRPLWRVGFLGLLALSLAVQVPGWAVDFDLWQNRLLETGLPLFDPLTFFRPVYSPLVGSWQFINPANLDLAWAVAGRINWSLVGLLLANLGLAGWVLARRWVGATNPLPQSRRASLIAVAAPLLTIVSLVVLLRQAHQQQPAALEAALATVNEAVATGVDLPLIYDDPLKAIPLAELYQGRSPVLGLLTLDEPRLDTFTATRPALWWLPAQQPQIETHLLRDHGVARSDSFDGQRLLLLARPDGPRHAIGARFGEAIELETAALSTTLRPQAPFAVELHWQALQAPAADYHIFIHLLDESGQTAAQTDGQPQNWTRPTSTWSAGETLTDPHALWVPDLSPGRYALIAGLYRPDTGQRLPTEAGSDRVLLAELILQP